MNTIAKNDEVYKSTPQVLLMSTAEYSLNYPLIKENENFTNQINPKISFRISTNEMKNYTNEDRNINFTNIFEIDRLGLADSFETGKSLTMGVEYKTENLENINNYFQFNIATVFRDKQENDIPLTTTLNKKQSNYFGSFIGNFDNYLNILKEKFSLSSLWILLSTIVLSVKIPQYSKFLVC